MVASRKTATNEHVAVFLPNLTGGGSERMAINLSRGLTESGLRVDLVVGAGATPYEADLDERVRVVDLDARRVRRMVPRLASYLRVERPRSLLSMMYHANVAAVLARALSRVPTRLVLSDRANCSEIFARMGRLQRAGAKLAIRLAYPRADAILEVSQGVADDLRQYANVAPGRVVVVCNPTITPELVERARAPVSCAWLEDRSVPVIAGMGRLNEQKDFSTLIRAVARVRSERRVRAVILGEGEDHQMLEALGRELGLGEDLALPGFVPNPHAVVGRCSAFVLSSRYEGLPNALIEAMPLGVPVISTDCASGPREILDGGRHGRLVPVGDVEAMAEAIHGAISGRLPPPSHEAWQRFTLEVASEGYRRVLLGTSPFTASTE